MPCQAVLHATAERSTALPRNPSRPQHGLHSGPVVGRASCTSGLHVAGGMCSKFWACLQLPAPRHKACRQAQPCVFGRNNACLAAHKNSVHRWLGLPNRYHVDTASRHYRCSAVSQTVCWQPIQHRCCNCSAQHSTLSAAAVQRQHTYLQRDQHRKQQCQLSQAVGAHP